MDGLPSGGGDEMDTFAEKDKAKTVGSREQ
jgi:hypothetical protein